MHRLRGPWALLFATALAGCGHGTGVPPDAALDGPMARDAARIDAPGLCGDRVCNTNESCALCAMDCGDCTPTCGDGTCGTDEGCDTCSADCGTCGARCGDDACDVRETCTSCPHDCGACSATCGDGHCEGGDTCTTCAADCGSCATSCDDGTCDASETCTSCLGDCGRCVSGCGDAVCDPAEDCVGCPADCGSCPGLVCGDGTCALTESCATCAADCGACAPFCGDGACDTTETCATCASDCGTCTGCGDGTCAPSESCATCPTDCSVCPGICGDGMCSTTETCAICAADCGSCATSCGDGACDATETCDLCAADCGACASRCGDHSCDATESCTTCAADCGSCGAFCGDASCDSGETCTSCPGDCGACGITCGDHACDPGETCADCPTDCAALCPTGSGHACPPTFTRPTRPAGCPFPAEVVIWTQNGAQHLIDALDADHTECAEYWVTLPHVAPAPGDATGPSRVRPVPTHRPSYAGLHFMAEFHWAGWSKWRRAHHATWTQAASMFLDAMHAAGYCPSSGDSWGINEIPSGARRGVSVCMGGAMETTCHTSADCPGTGPCQPIRDSVIEVVRTLHAGNANVPPSRGAVFVVNYGQDQPRGVRGYHDYLESWLGDDSFWVGISPHVRFWSQEVYADPRDVCPSARHGSTLAERASAIQEFTENTPRLVTSAPIAMVGPARSYLGRSYMPLMNAFYGSDGAYGHTEITLEHMQMLVTEQVVATRQWADAHAYAPDGRIGFGFGAKDWNDASPLDVSWDAVATRMAAAIRRAYGPHATATSACAEGTSAMRWCSCEIDAGAFQSPDPWATFSW